MDTVRPTILALLDLILVQTIRIGPYWLAGVVAGSFVSVFLPPRIAAAARRMKAGESTVPGMALASVLGAASPVCMYGTVPLLASLGRTGVPQETIAAFMVSSILINPSLFIFSFALGAPLALTRLAVCLGAGMAAGALVRLLFRDRRFFTFEGVDRRGGAESGRGGRDLLMSVYHGVVRTGPYLLVGILLTALFDHFFPRDWAVAAFGANKGLGVVVSAAIGVPVYVCGGGTIPLLRAWIEVGMSPGSAIAFMASGPATKLTNLGAVKIVLGTRSLLLYLGFSLLIAVIAGLAVDGLCGLVSWSP